jgi:hypothetical protein
MYDRELMDIQLAILGLGFWQTWSGFSLIERGSGGDLIVPLVVYILWGVIVGVSLAESSTGTRAKRNIRRSSLRFIWQGLVSCSMRRTPNPLILSSGLIPLQLRREEQRRTVQFYGGEKAAYIAQTPAYGTTTATAEPEMRSRYMSSTHMGPRSNAVTLAEPRANAVALATPVDVGFSTSAENTHSGTSLSSLEQEILDRERRTSAVPLIDRK